MSETELETKALAMIEAIYNEIVELHHNREIWKYLNDELPKRGGSTINRALTHWYIDSQSSTIRRMASNRSQDKTSLYRLLEVIGGNLDTFKSKYGVTISTEVINADIVTLKAETAKIVRWADEKVAHLGRKSTSNPTFDDLDAAVNLLGSLMSKYNQLLTGAGLPEVTPVITDDWRAPFSKAWF
jgi:hypothetical protein